MHYIILGLLLLCFASTLYMCRESYVRLRANFGEPRLFLLLAVAIYSLAMLYGVAVRAFGVVDDPTIIGRIAGARGASYGITRIMQLLCVATSLLAALNVALGVIIRRTKFPIAYCLVTIVALMTLFGIAGAFFGIGSNPLTSLFMGCVGAMFYFAWLLNLTYEEFCTIGNIFVQAGICLLASTAPLWLCIRRRADIAPTLACATNTAVHAAAFCTICAHYWLPLEEGFALCVADLRHLAAGMGITYEEVNIIIFVIAFLCDIAFNALIYRSTRRSVK